VELLLDVAEAVIEEVGYDATTTNLVASRAGVPVGTLYRWFPDKAALAEAVADRYLDDLLALSDELLADIDPGERIGDFVHRVVQRLIAETSDHRALPALLASAMVPGGRSSAGRRLREALEGHIRSLVDRRVPGIPVELRNRTAEVCTTLTQVVISSAASAPDGERDRLTAEYVDVMLAYLEAKFPSADHPVWTDPDAPVRPLFPAPDRAARLASEPDARRARP
jgi:AcrR family transcriptional regulator